MSLLKVDTKNSFSAECREMLDYQIDICLHDMLIECMEDTSYIASKIGEDHENFFDTNIQFWESLEEYERCHAIIISKEKYLKYKNEKK